MGFSKFLRDIFIILGVFKHFIYIQNMLSTENIKRGQAWMNSIGRLDLVHRTECAR